MISSNLVDKITSMLFDDINNADDGTMIVYFVAEFMKSFYKPYCESLDSDDITKRNFYFDFCNNELLNFLVDYDDSEYISVEFKKGAIILSDYYTNTELLNNALKNTATVICKKYRDEKSEDEWDECFHRRYATAFRAFLFNLEELATRKIGDCDDESGLSVLLHNLSIAMSEYSNSDINYKIVEDLFIDNTLSKSNIDQLVRAFSKIQLLIWQNKVLYPEIVAEKYELSILGLNASLKFAENTDGINKDVYDYFIGKFFRTVDSTYLKSLNLGIRTIVYKMILDVEDNEIGVSLKILTHLCSSPKEKNLLNSITFIPRNKKIVLYDLPGLSFDDNTIFTISRICKYFNIVDENSNVDTDMDVCYNKNESKSWELLFDCIKSGHLDFNSHIEEAKTAMNILNISPN